MIQVDRKNGGRYEVTVFGDTKTTHHVTLSEDYHHKLTGGRETEESLIERSFAYLLRHEPNTAILGEFDLTAIEGYFPGFEKEISGNLGET